jgi:hypothetical protein
VIGVVLLIMESVLSVVLIFENFGENSFGVNRLTVVIYRLSVALDAHASSMDCIELSLNIRGSSRRSLATSSGLWSSITLSYRRSGNLNFSSWSRYQILGLITAWLEHQALWLLSVTLHTILHAGRINRLPSIFGTRLDLSILHHSVDNLLVSHIISSLDIISFAVAIFLVYQSHG